MPYVTEKWRGVPLCRMSERGHERRFRAVRRMSAYLLTAAESQTFSNRRLGPKAEMITTIRQHSVDTLVDGLYDGDGNEHDGHKCP